MHDFYLCEEIKLHPLTEPVDAAKWMFQRTFGCSHLLSSPKAAKEYLEAETKSISHRAETAEITELGRGMLRFALDTPYALQCGNDLIFQAMEATAQDNHGSIAQLEEELSIVALLSKERLLPFAYEEWIAFSRQWKASGYPVVSHSKRYHDTYLPHYRVISADQYLLTRIVARMNQMKFDVEQPLLILVEGPCASGKSSLAALLEKRLGATLIHTDDYYCLPPNRRNEIAGHMDFDKLRGVLVKLLRGQSTKALCWQCLQNSFHSLWYQPNPILILEGSYGFLAANSLPANTLRVFLSIDKQEQLKRLALRNPGLLSDFENRWIPFETQYYSAFNVPGSADLTLKSYSW